MFKVEHVLTVSLSGEQGLYNLGPVGRIRPEEGFWFDPCAVYVPQNCPGWATKKSGNFCELVLKRFSAHTQKKVPDA